jgi:hypothetical protein
MYDTCSSSLFGNKTRMRKEHEVSKIINFKTESILCNREGSNSGISTSKICKVTTLTTMDSKQDFFDGSLNKNLHVDINPTEFKKQRQTLAQRKIIKIVGQKRNLPQGNQVENEINKIKESSIQRSVSIVRKKRGRVPFDPQTRLFIEKKSTKLEDTYDIKRTDIFKSKKIKPNLPPEVRKISFNSRRKTCEFLCYEKEERKIRFSHLTKNSIHPTEGDDDCDTDEEQIQLAVRVCFNQFLRALDKSCLEFAKFEEDRKNRIQNYEKISNVSSNHRRCSSN